MSLGRHLRKPSEPRKYAGWEGFVLPNCNIGLEFEFEGVHNQELPSREAWASLWEFHEDRSLRDGGAEYVFRSPMFGEDAYNATSALLSYARTQGWRSSKRTGIHIHMDARDLEVPQLLGIALLYALYEPAIFRWIGDDRENNVFCLPWYRAEGAISEVSSLLRTAILDPDSLPEYARNVNRYAGTNLHSLGVHGSIEFRHLKTTLDLQRVVNWINIVLSLKLGAQRAPTCDGALLRMIEDMGPRRAGRELLGPTFDLLDYQELESDVMSVGMVTANQIVLEGIEQTPPWEPSQIPQGRHEGFMRFIGALPPLAEAPPVVEFPPSEPQTERQRERQAFVNPFTTESLRRAGRREEPQREWPRVEVRRPTVRVSASGLTTAQAAPSPDNYVFYTAGGRVVAQPQSVAPEDQRVLDDIFDPPAPR